MATSAERTPWSQASFLPSAPVSLGLVGNPHARALRAHDGQIVRDLKAVLPSELASRFRLTDSLDALGPTLLEHIRAGVNVLAVAGGDGTLHHTLNALASLGGGTPWPGTLLVLRGGTLNIVARSLGPMVEPAEALRAFALDRAFVGASYGDVPTKTVPMLSVRHETLGLRHGFLFGSEMVKNALEMYDQFGGGYGGLSRFLFEVARGFAFRGELWQRESWRLEPPSSGARVIDDRGRETDVPRYSAAIACAVDLVINGGVRAVHRAAGAQGFAAKIITETRTAKLLGMIPALMHEGSPKGVHDIAEASALTLRGSYTLDGECFGASARGRGAEIVHVGARERARFVGV